MKTRKFDAVFCAGAGETAALVAKFSPKFVLSAIRLLMLSLLSWHIVGCNNMGQIKSFDADPQNSIESLYSMSYSGEIVLLDSPRVKGDRNETASSECFTSTNGLSSFRCRYNEVGVVDNAEIEVSSSNKHEDSKSYSLFFLKGSRYVRPLWCQTCLGEILVVYAETDAHTDNIYAFRTLHQEQKVALLYFGPVAFGDCFIEHKHIDESSINLTYDCILSYDLDLTAQNPAFERKIAVQVPIACVVSGARKEKE